MFWLTLLWKQDSKEKIRCDGRSRQINSINSETRDKPNYYWRKWLHVDFHVSVFPSLFLSFRLLIVSLVLYAETKAQESSPFHDLWQGKYKALRIQKCSVSNKKETPGKIEAQRLNVKTLTRELLIPYIKKWTRFVITTNLERMIFLLILYSYHWMEIS